MIDAIETMMEPIRRSPFLPEITRRLHRELCRESELREVFYREMTPEQKVDFIAGEVVMHPPARNAHLDVTLNIGQLLATYVRIHALGEIKVEKCLCVFPRNDYEPDVVFFGKEKSAGFTADTMKFPPPDLIVEVISESTEERDRGVKFQDYEAHGVGEYWIVDAERRCVEQYLAGADGYRLELKSATGELRSRAIAGLAIPVEAMFGSGENLAFIRRMVGH
jgi:Uma2 family endonuclease